MKNQNTIPLPHILSNRYSAREGPLAKLVRSGICKEKVGEERREDLTSILRYCDGECTEMERLSCNRE